jgi:hypothetical protein
MRFLRDIVRWYRVFVVRFSCTFCGRALCRHYSRRGFCSASSTNCSRRLNGLLRRRPQRLLAVRQPYIKRWMFDAVEPRAFSKHPAGKNPLLLAVLLDFINLDKRRRLRLFRGWARIARAWRHPQRPEGCRLAKLNFEFRAVTLSSAEKIAT